MNKYYPHLFSPLKVGDVTLRNRILYAPNCGVTSVENGMLNKAGLDYYEERAAGMPAVVSTGENFIMEGAVPGGRFCLYEDLDAPMSGANTRNASEYLAGLKRHGTLAEAQLTYHGGEGMVDKTGYTMGPSAFTRADGVEVKGMDEAMMAKMCEDFAKCAERAKLLGFDLIQLHGGHGWIFTQFLSRRTNRRGDEYGGSLENRARFPIRIIKAVRERVGAGYPIELRLSWEEKLPDGITLEETIAFCKMIDGLVDIIQISTGNHLDEPARHDSYTVSSHYYPVALNAQAEASVKKELKKSFVSVVGAVNDPDIAEEIIASGKADLIALGRQAIADPYFARKLKEGKPWEVDRCVRCLKCYDRRSEKLRTPWCSVNPLFGHEANPNVQLRYARRAEKVLVVGGGPAGMKAAVTAAKCGHAVTLMEKSGSLGGTLRFVFKDAHKQDLSGFLNNLIARTYKAGVDVRLGAEVTPEMILDEAPYAVICAVGADPVVPDIPGIGLPHVMHAVDAYSGIKDLGQDIVIIGGGSAGCETAVHLGALGKKTVVIEVAQEVAVGVPYHPRGALLGQLERYGVDVRTEHSCVGIREGAVTVRDKNATEFELKADSVVYSVGMRPRRAMVDALADLSAVFIAAGDCKKAAAMREAIWDGYYAGNEVTPKF